jgi:hypothetical protein
MTQHKSIHVIPPKQWLKKLQVKKGSGSLSATAIVESDALRVTAEKSLAQPKR